MDDQTLQAILEQYAPQDKSAIGHVSDFLSALNKPNQALYGGIMSGLSSDPNDTFWEGMKKGWNDQTDYSLADVVGLPKPQSEDEWATWLAKAIPHLVVSAVGDPLNLAFVPAKGAGLAGRAIKGLGVPEGKSIAGLAAGAAHLPQAADWFNEVTGLGKAFRHGTGNEAMDLVHAGLNRQLGETKVFVEEQQKQIADKLKEMGITAERHPEIYHALEWGAEALPPDVSKDVLDLFKPLRDKRQELFTLENQLREAKKLEPVANLSGDGYEYMPHIRTDLKPSQNPESRTLFRWKYLDEPGGFVMDDTTGKPFLSADKPAFLKEAGIKGNEKTGWIDTATGRPVDRSPQTSLQDILTGNVGLESKQFITDPAEALGHSLTAAQKRVNFLQQLEAGEAKGLLGSIENAPKEWRALNIPGLDNLAAEPKYADFLENQARAAFDRSTTIGGIGDALARFNESGPGQKFKQFTDFWKGTTLPLHPGWFSGNIASGAVQSVITGDISPAKLGPRIVQAIEVALGRGENVIPQLKEAGLDILHEAKIRDINPKTGLFGSTGEEVATGKPGLFGKVGEAPPFKQIEQLQQKGYKAGGGIENVQKLTVFIDQIKKTMPENFATMPKEAQAQLLDKAAQKAQQALIDYSPQGGWTAFEQELMSLIPFLKWQRGLAGQTATSLTESPQKLAALSRALDMMLQPMAPDDKKIMDSWSAEQMPIRGMFGHTFDVDAQGNPQMALAGRFLPHGNVEQFVKRPWDFASSVINPAIKTPLELATNYSSFKDKPIDELSGGFPYNVTAPITGGPYQSASQQQFGQTLPAAYDYLLTQAPGGRYLREANELARATGLTEDVYKDANPDANTFASWWLTGGKQYPFDRSAALMRRKKEQDKQDAALRHDLNYAALKGDTGRMERTMNMQMDQQGRKLKALGMVEAGQ
jgi:hypothetical protein